MSPARLPSQSVDSNKRLWIYAGLVLAAGVGLVTAVPDAPPMSTRPPTGPDARLLLVGDSLAQGLSVPLAAIAKSVGASLFVAARSGTRMDQWASSNGWLEQALAAAKPQVVLVSLGTNDMKLATTGRQDLHMSRILSMIRAAPSGTAEPVWIMPPTLPFGDPRGIRPMLSSAAIRSFRSDAMTIPRAADGVHPTAAGYAGWAAHLWKWLYAAHPLSGVNTNRREPGGVIDTAGVFGKHRS